MERAADIQRQAAPCPGSKRQLGSLIDSGLVAANDQLAGAVVVADLHNAFVGAALQHACKGASSSPKTAVIPQVRPAAAAAIALPRKAVKATAVCTSNTPAQARAEYSPSDSPAA